VFLALDKVRLQDWDEAIRRYLAWKTILDEKEARNLDPHQVKQAETHLASADSAVGARLPEAYQWLLVPVQTSPQSPLQWQALRLTGQEALAVRASKKLKNDELLVTTLAGTRLRMEMERVPLWRGDHVIIKQLVEDFCRYVYLPRLADASVLVQAVREGLALLTWDKDSFAYADSYDDAAGRYRGLRCGEVVNISENSLSGLLVKPDVAAKQRESEAKSTPGAVDGATTGVGTATGGPSPTPPSPPTASRPTRFHGTVTLDAARVGRDAGRVADEVISHLSGLVGSSVKVTLEITAHVPGGVSESVVRTVTENSRALKFDNHGFEQE
jgi:hypothetical protein